jgi:glycerol-3-phosphate dehydrogenase
METINIFNPEWTYKNRQNYFDRIGTEKFDVIIIGGGMTGAGVARECALRGIKTLLLDKNDFAFGTSSRSSKLAHGGFRYIQQFEFKLVKESTTERNWLRVHFPNICRPVIFNFASFKGSKETPFLMKLGITLYDHLSTFGQNTNRPESIDF